MQLKETESWTIILLLPWIYHHVYSVGVTTFNKSVWGLLWEISKLLADCSHALNWGLFEIACSGQHKIKRKAISWTLQQVRLPFTTEISLGIVKRVSNLLSWPWVKTWVRETQKLEHPISSDPVKNLAINSLCPSLGQNIGPSLPIIE